MKTTCKFRESSTRGWKSTTCYQNNTLSSIVTCLIFNLELEIYFCLFCCQCGYRRLLEYLANSWSECNPLTHEIITETNHLKMTPMYWLIIPCNDPLTLDVVAVFRTGQGCLAWRPDLFLATSRSRIIDLTSSE